MQIRSSHPLSYAGIIYGRLGQARAISKEGLSPRYGTIFLFLEQIIARSIACGARGYMLRGVLRMWRSVGKCMAPEIPKIFYGFGPQFNALMSVGILLKYFRRKYWFPKLTIRGIDQILMIYEQERPPLRVL